MAQPLFDHRLRKLRRDRAVRLGVESFLFDRAFEDCLDRLDSIQQEFPKVLLAGCPNPNWAERLKAQELQVIDPGPLMASQAGGQCADLEALPFEAASFDLCLTVGLLDTANNLPLAAAALHFVLKPGGLLLGAIPGGHSLPRLRHAMLAADRSAGMATPHVHPRIEASSLARLLTEAGFQMPVIDIDKVKVSYSSLKDLVADLRAMGATNILSARSRRPIARKDYAAAQKAFVENARTVEPVEILHFAGWKRP